MCLVIDVTSAARLKQLYRSMCVLTATPIQVFFNMELFLKERAAKTNRNLLKYDNYCKSGLEKMQKFLKIHV